MESQIISGIVGGLIGIVIGTWLTHRLNIKYTLRKTFFEKKIEYTIKTSRRLEEQSDIFYGLLSKIIKMREEDFNKKKLERFSKSLKGIVIDIKMEDYPIFFNLKIDIPNKILEYGDLRRKIESKFKEIASVNNKTDLNNKILDLEVLIKKMVHKGFEVVAELTKEIRKF